MDAVSESSSVGKRQKWLLLHYSDSFEDFFFFLRVWCSACIYVQPGHAWFPQRSEGNTGSSRVELQTVEGHHVGAGNRTLVLCPWWLSHLSGPLYPDSEAASFLSPVNCLNSHFLLSVCAGLGKRRGKENMQKTDVEINIYQQKLGKPWSVFLPCTVFSWFPRTPRYL